MKKNFILPAILFLSLGVFYGFNGHKADTGRSFDANPQYENLQVLPKDISEEGLKHVMDSFKYALGVKCSFCHVAGSDGKMDWASDDNKHKDIARNMMRMTMDINTNYFKIENPQEFKVDCFSCHNGSEKPALTPAEAFKKPEGR